MKVVKTTYFQWGPYIEKADIGIETKIQQQNIN